MLFCTFLIISTIGNTAGIGNSFAQRKQLGIQSPSTISMSTTQPLKNKQNKVPATQPLNNTQNTIQPLNNTQTTNTITFTSEQHIRGPRVIHLFSSGFPGVGGNVVGSDRFRFIKSFWTSSDVSVNPNPGDNICPQSATTPTASSPSLPPNSPVITTPSSVSGQPTSGYNIEVDKDEGYATLVVLLQYQGVVTLAGMSAALGLPSGFAAQLPLETDRNNYNIALSNIADKDIKPGESVALCFPLNVLPNAVVQLPVLGPLALHFLRPDVRAITDSILAEQEGHLKRTLTTANGSIDVHTDDPKWIRTLSDFNRIIPFDYINQVIPVIWKVTGREILDVSLPAASPGVATSLECPSQAVVKAASPPCVIPVNVVFSNLGDVGIHNLVATFAANFTSVEKPNRFVTDSAQRFEIRRFLPIRGTPLYECDRHSRS